MTAIRANSILPARRSDIELQTADGVTLVGEVALPADRDPVATIVCLHPLPTHGGMMDSHVFRKAAWRLPALAGVAVVRFNSRGTASVRGTSGGAFDGGVAERYDVSAAIEYAEFAGLPSIWLVGWSFGTDLVLKYGCDPTVVGAILLSPPLRFSTADDLAVWDAAGKPLVALVPEFDDYLRPAEARTRFAAIRQAEVIGVPGAKHLWVGHAETALDEIVRRVAPAAYPLPTNWDGPMEFGDASAYANRTTAAFADVPMPDTAPQ
jgi:alpha/beta superfamily hydrolase